MKKLFPMVLAFLLVSMVASAQSPVPAKAAVYSSKAYFAITYGWALPQGNFASVDPPAAGFANHGSQFTVQGGITPAKNFALELDYFYARYGIKNDAVSGTGLFLDNWKYSGFTFGPAIKIPMGKRFEANIKVKAGVAWVKSAVPNNNSNVIADVKASTFILKPGFDLRYHINPRVFIIGNLDWAYMSPKFKYSGGNDLDQLISALHLGFGFGVSF
jgi:hypothetical protein